MVHFAICVARDHVGAAWSSHTGGVSSWLHCWQPSAAIDESDDATSEVLTSEVHAYKRPKPAFKEPFDPTQAPLPGSE